MQKVLLVWLFTILSITALVAQKPEISGFTPVSGPTGSIVTITGANFADNPASNIVKFGNVLARVLTASANTLTVEVPTASQYQPITVTAQGLTTYSTGSFNLTFPGAHGLWSRSFFPHDNSIRPDVNNIVKTIKGVDLDDDGKTDLLTGILGNYSSNFTINVRRNISENNLARFAPVQTIVCGDYKVEASDIAAADFDGDGKTDLVVMSRSAYNIILLRNSSTIGNISFEPAVVVKLPFGTTGMAISINDFNSDGKPDIAFLDPQQKKLFLYHNTTTNNVLSLEKGWEASLPANPTSIHSADLDNDNKPDLLVGLYASDGLLIFRNSSSGTASIFDAPKVLQTNSAVYSVTCADLNNDGKSDIAASLINIYAFGVWQNNSTPGVINAGALQTFPTEKGVNRIAAADMDGDGKPDLVSGNQNSYDVTVLRNNSANGIIHFHDPFNYWIVPISPIYVHVADFTGDGRPDIATASLDNASIGILRNDVTESLISSFTPTTAATGEKVTITGENFEEVTSVMFGNSPAASFNIISPTSIEAIVADGSIGDISLISPYHTSKLAGFTYSGPPVINSFTPGTTSTSSMVTITGKNFTNISSVKFGGKEALRFTVESTTIIKAAVPPTASGEITVVNNYGSGAKSGFVFVHSPQITGFSAATAEPGSKLTINGSNFAPNAARNSVYFGSQKATVTSATATSITVTVPKVSGLQVITVNCNDQTAYSANGFRVLMPDNDVPFDDHLFLRESPLLQSDLRIQKTLIKDLDGDGKPDMILKLASTLEFYRNTGSGNSVAYTKTGSLQLPNPYYGAEFQLQDVNGDGKQDIIFNYPFSIWLNNGTDDNISFTKKWEPTNRVFSGMFYDMDSDGKPDLICEIGTNWTPRTGIYKNYSVGEQLYFEEVAIEGNLSSQLPVIADLDGDGKPDMVLSQDKKISVLRNTGSSGIISFAPAVSYNIITNENNFGFTATDMDGDGRYELVFKTSVELFVFSNKSTAGNLNFTTQPVINTLGYLGLPSDLNGDGKIDFFATSNGMEEFGVLKNKSTAGQYVFDKFRLDNEVRQNIYTITDVDGDGLQDIVCLTEERKLTYFKNDLYRPVIRSVTPSTGLLPGTKITVEGFSFKQTKSVQLGEQPVASFKVISNNKLEATVGEGNPGKISIQNQLSSNYFNGINFAPPVIKSLSSVSGPVGSVVTLTGSNFSTIPANNHVTFGSIRAEVLSAQLTSLQVRVPVSAANAPVSINTFKLAASSSQHFNVAFNGLGTKFTAKSFGDTASFVVSPGVRDYNNAEGMAIADFNNDGKPDVAVVDWKAKTVSILINTSTPGQTSFEPRITYSDLTDPSHIIAVDFNNDKKTDLAICSSDSWGGGSIAVFQNTSTDVEVSFSMLFPMTCGGVRRLEAADFDGDGKIDFFAGTGFVESQGCIFRNTSEGDSISFKSQSTNVGEPLWRMAVDDIDGDNKPDLIFVTDVRYGLIIMKNTSTPGNIGFGERVSYSLPDIAHAIGTADLDGDGKKDIIVSGVIPFRNTTASGKISFVQEGTLPENKGEYFAFADMDGDGKPDILSRTDYSNTPISLYKNNSTIGSIKFEAPVKYLPDGSLMSVRWIDAADIDGDKKTDIVAVNTYPGEVMVLRNKSGEPSVQPNGTKPVSGNIITKLFIDPEIQSLNGQSYVQRHADLIPVNDPNNATATITMYFSQAEFNAFNASPNHGPNLPSSANDAVGKSNLRVYQYHGASDSHVPGDYSGTGKEIDPDDDKIKWNEEMQWWEVTFDVSGFSGFFVSTKGFNYQQTPAPQISADYTSFCNGGQVQLTSSAAANNQWYKNGVIIPGANATTYATSEAGNYTVTATNHNLVSPPSKPVQVTAGSQLTKPVISREGGLIQSSGPSGNQWYREGVLIPGANGRTLVPEDGFAYTVQVSLNGCVSPMSDRYQFLVTGIIDIDDQQYLRLSPNPVQGIARLDFKLEGTTRLNMMVSDMNGRILLQLFNQASGAGIDLQQLPRGIYVMQLFNQSGKKRYSMKFIRK